MLDFQRGPKPRNYLSRREQGRLLFLVMMLGLVVIVALEARKPEHYRWLLGGEQGGADLPVAGEGSSAGRQIDARVQPGQGPPSRYFPGVKPGYLKSLRDNRLLGNSEWEGLLHFFDLLQKNDEATLQGASSGRVSLVQLFEQSNEYRGELVTTKGTIRRAGRVKLPKNEHGLTHYYRIWLWPADHPTDPMMVWCLHLPEGFPMGMEIAEEAEVTGFYYRLVSYKAGGGQMLRAPMLLARTVHWRRKPDVAKTPTPQRGPLSLALLIAGSAAFALLTTAYVYYRTRRQGPSRLESLQALGTPRDAETPADLGAALNELAETQPPEPQGPAIEIE